MARESDTGTELRRDRERELALVRTFKIVGGGSFELTIPHQPTLLHHGRATVWTMLGTEAEAEKVKAKIIELRNPAQVEVYCTQQTPEQTAIRKVRLGLFVLECGDDGEPT